MEKIEVFKLPPNYVIGTKHNKTKNCKRKDDLDDEEYRRNKERAIKTMIEWEKCCRGIHDFFNTIEAKYENNTDRYAIDGDSVRYFWKNKEEIKKEYMAFKNNKPEPKEKLMGLVEVKEELVEAEKENIDVLAICGKYILNEEMIKYNRAIYEKYKFNKKMELVYEETKEDYSQDENVDTNPVCDKYMSDNKVVLKYNKRICDKYVELKQEKEMFKYKNLEEYLEAEGSKIIEEKGGRIQKSHFHRKIYIDIKLWGGSEEIEEKYIKETIKKSKKIVDLGYQGGRGWYCLLSKIDEYKSWKGKNGFKIIHDKHL